MKTKVGWAAVVFCALTPLASFAQAEIPKFDCGRTEHYVAWGSDERMSAFQLAAHEGANASGFKSGCAATAWINLIGWYDLKFNPSLLSGRHTGNDPEIDKLMLKLAMRMETFGVGDNGATDPRNLARGYDFIRETLRHKPVGEASKFIWPYETDESELIRIARESLKAGRPVIVFTTSRWGDEGILDTTLGWFVAGHYAVAYAFLGCSTEPGEDEKNFVLVAPALRDQGGPRADKWIPFDDIAGVWALGDLTPLDRYQELSEASSKPPTTASGGGKTLLAWVGKDDKQSLNVLRSTDGWSYPAATKQTLPWNSEARPGLAYFSKAFVLAWRDGSGKLRIAFELPPPNWVFQGSSLRTQRADGSEERPTAAAGPALAVFKGRLYAAWADEANRLHVASTDRPLFNVWRESKALSELTDRDPALAASDGELVLAWKGMDPAGSLNVLRSDDGVSFAGKVTLPETTDDEPGLAFLDQDLYLAWSGKDNHRINLLRRGADRRWLEKVTLSETSTGGPWLAPASGEMMVVWVGTSGASTISFRKEDLSH